MNSFSPAPTKAVRPSGDCRLPLPSARGRGGRRRPAGPQGGSRDRHPAAAAARELELEYALHWQLKLHSGYSSYTQVLAESLATVIFPQWRESKSLPCSRAPVSSSFQLCKSLNTKRYAQIQNTPRCRSQKGGLGRCKSHVEVAARAANHGHRAGQRNEHAACGHPSHFPSRK